MDPNAHVERGARCPLFNKELQPLIGYVAPSWHLLSNEVPLPLIRWCHHGTRARGIPLTRATTRCATRQLVQDAT